jgi:phosphoglycolate phosphatase
MQRSADLVNTKGVIFDFDGTLTKLTLDFPSLKAEILKIARRYVPEEMIISLEGHYILEIIYRIRDSLQGDGADFSFEAFEKLKVLELAASRGKDVYPYTRDVLGHLKRKGLKTGIITRSFEDVVRTVFPDVDEYMDGIITCEHIRRVKPHPDHAIAAADLLLILPGEGVMVGDHPTDVVAGREAGMKTIGLLSGRSSREDFEKEGATYIMDDIRGIPLLLR